MAAWAAGAWTSAPDTMDDTDRELEMLAELGHCNGDPTCYLEQPRFASNVAAQLLLAELPAPDDAWWFVDRYHRCLQVAHYGATKEDVESTVPAMLSGLLKPGVPTAGGRAGVQAAVTGEVGGPTRRPRRPPRGGGKSELVTKMGEMNMGLLGRNFHQAKDEGGGAEQEEQEEEKKGEGEEEKKEEAGCAAGLSELGAGRWTGVISSLIE